jgi:hypothetical protein
MFRSPRHRHVRPSILGGMLLALAAAPALEAQAVEAMDFPRQILEWYLAGEGERVWEYAGESFRSLAETPEGMGEAGTELTAMMGAPREILDEQVFPHPDGEGHQVYVRTLAHAEVPELFWIVIFEPGERRVQMIMPQPRQTVTTLFPGVRVP